MKPSRIVIALCVLLGFAVPLAVASDSDLQQYNGTSTWQDDLAAASTLLPRDGKRITADNNSAGSAPVNRSLKQFKDYLLALHDGVVGSRSGSQLRTLRAVQVDGLGGSAATTSDGTIRAVGDIFGANFMAVSTVMGTSLKATRVVNSTTLPTQTITAGEYTKDTAVAGLASFTYSVASSTLTVHAASNVLSITRTGAGAFTVVFNRAPSGANANNAVTLVSEQLGSVGMPTFTTWANGLDGSNRLKLDISTGAVDVKFNVVAWIF